MFISVIIPVHNGEDTISECVQYVVNYFSKKNYTYEVIIVNDCSSDDTALILDQMTEWLCLVVINKNVWQGKGATIKSGLKIAKGDYVLLMDGDSQIRPEELDVFFKVMEFNNADAVVGNKHHPYSNTQYSTMRSLVSNGYHFLTKILFNLSLRDTQCGFKLFKAHCLKVVLSKLRVKQFAFDLELMVALKENNFRVADAPVFVSRPLGNGSVTLYNIINTFKDTLIIWHRKNKGFYK